MMERPGKKCAIKENREVKSSQRSARDIWVKSVLNRTRGAHLAMCLALVVHAHKPRTALPEDVNV